MHIEKEKIRVTAMTERFRIVGDMYRYPGSRILDLISIKDAAFIALTDVEVYGLEDGKLINKVPFVAINRNAIQFFYPVDAEQREQA